MMVFKVYHFMIARIRSCLFILPLWANTQYVFYLVIDANLNVPKSVRSSDVHRIANQTAIVDHVPRPGPAEIVFELAENPSVRRVSNQTVLSPLASLTLSVMHNYYFVAGTEAAKLVQNAAVQLDHGTLSAYREAVHSSVQPANDKLLVCRDIHAGDCINHPRRLQFPNKAARSVTEAVNWIPRVFVANSPSVVADRFSGNDQAEGTQLHGAVYKLAHAADQNEVVAQGYCLCLKTSSVNSAHQGSAGTVLQNSSRRRRKYGSSWSNFDVPVKTISAGLAN